MFLALIAVLIAGILVSCGENVADTQDGADGAPTLGEGNLDEDVSAEPVRLEPNLPDNSYFNGFTFTFLSHLETSGYNWYGEEPREIVSEAETGAPINDAIFRRNAALTERHGFEFELIAVSDEVGALRRVVNAGDDVYDAAIIYNHHVPNAVQNGLLADVARLPYLDLDKPWWDDAVNGMSVMGRNFLLAGDLLILDNEATNALVFNKDLMRDLGHPLPYDLVTEGRWTLEALDVLIREAAIDLDGDGVMTEENDQWGIVTFNDALHAFFVGGGGLLAEKDDRDIPFINFASEQNIRITERAMDFLFDTSFTYNVQREGYGPTGNPYRIFQEGRALFMWVRMRVIETLRGMDADFGILPMPKFDESQQEYRSVVNPYTGVLLGIPLTAPDLERTSIILEAISAESRYTLQPAYYDVVLTRQFARDEESEDMLDIIFGNRIYDIGAVYGFGSNVWINFIELSGTLDRGIATLYERRSPAMVRDIERLVERIEDLD
jgi:hypothetical protein